MDGLSSKRTTVGLCSLGLPSPLGSVLLPSTELSVTVVPPGVLPLPTALLL